MANFFEGWNLIKQGAPTLQAANPTAAQARRVRPLFERAIQLLEGAGAYTEQARSARRCCSRPGSSWRLPTRVIRAGR
jgi:hypothetical protein